MSRPQHTHPRSHAAAAVTALVAAAVSACGALKRFGYEGIGRDRWQRPELVVNLLGIRPGERIADVGAGGGYFTFRLAAATGPEGVVYAVDTDDDMVRHLAGRAADNGLRQVVAVRAAPDDPRLPEDVDLVFTCNTWHHLPDRVRYMSRLRARLKPGGRVAVIEHDGKHGLMPTFGHATGKDVIRAEMEAAGFRLVQDHPLPQQSFQVFVPADAS